MGCVGPSTFCHYFIEFPTENHLLLIPWVHWGVESSTKNLQLTCLPWWAAWVKDKLEALERTCAAVRWVCCDFPTLVSPQNNGRETRMAMVTTKTKTEQQTGECFYWNTTIALKMALWKSGMAFHGHICHEKADERTIFLQVKEQLHFYEGWVGDFTLIKSPINKP